MMRATRDDANKIKRIHVVVIPPAAFPLTFTSMLIGTLSGGVGGVLPAAAAGPARSFTVSPKPTIPPEQTLIPASRTLSQRVQTLLIGPRGDDVAVKLRRGVEVVVVVVQPCGGGRCACSSFNVPSVIRASGPISLRPSPSAPDAACVAVVRVLPRRAPYRSRSSRRFSPCERESSTCSTSISRSGFETGFVARALRAILQSSGQAPVLIDSSVLTWNMARIEVLTMHLLGFEHQLKERFVE